MQGAKRALTLLTLAFAVAGCGGGGGGGGGADAPARFEAGFLDASFAAGGVLTRAYGSFSPDGVALGRDGSVFLAIDPALTKYDPAGRVDTSFGANGVVSTGYNTLLALDSAGNLYVVTGNTVTLLDSGGRAVASFGANGRAVLGVWSSIGASPSAFRRAPDGSLYIAGATFAAGVARVAVMKLDASGHTVTDFAAGGTLIIGAGDGPTLGQVAAAVDESGNLYVAAPLPVGFTHSTALWKFDSAGRPDASFGVNGMWRGPECGGGGNRSSIAVQSDGAVLLATGCGPYHAGEATFSRPALFKIDSAGRTVSAFRDSGLRQSLFGTNPEFQWASAIAIGPTGAIYVGGNRQTSEGSCGEIAVAKLDRDGNPVTSFGNNGVVSHTGPGSPFWLAIDGLGRLYMAEVTSPCASAVVSPGPNAINVYRLVP